MSEEKQFIQKHHRVQGLLRAEDVARILELSQSFVYQLMQRGEIKTVRMGRSVRVRPEDLEKFITENLSGE